MSVGLPGSGLGGVFYLLSALVMPFTSFTRYVRGDVTQLRLALRQSALAISIIATLYFTGVAVDMVMFSGTVAGDTVRAQHEASFALPRIFQGTSFLITFGTLAFVLGLVQVLRLVVPNVQQTVDRVADIPERRAA